MINKKYIPDRIPECDIKDIEYEINRIKPEIRERFLREYTLTKIPTPHGELTKSDREKNYYLLTVIRKNIERRKNNLPITDTRYISFFDKFPGYTKKEVLYAIQALNEKDLKLLHKKYGENFENTIKNENITIEENRIINENITRKIIKILNKLKSGKYILVGIEDIFNDIPFNELQQTINSLNSKTIKKLVYTNFGISLRKKALVLKEKSNPLTPEAVNTIYNIFYKKEYHRQVFPSFISQFYKYRKENETDEELLARVKELFVKLNDYELELLYRKYGEDLSNTEYKGQFNKEENKIICRRIIAKLKGLMQRIMEILYYKPLMDHFDKLTPYEEVINEINSRPLHEQELLKIKFDNDYLGMPEFGTIDHKVNVKTKDILYKMYTKILLKREQLTGIKPSTSKKIRQLLYTDEYKFLEGIYGTNYAAALMIEKYLSYECSIDSIVKLTGVDKKELLVLTKYYLLMEYNILGEEQNILKRVR